jgi:formylglycine-generating enzyme required for sulfatase activity
MFAMKKVVIFFIMLFAVMVSARAERTVIFEGDSFAHPTVIPLPLVHDGVTLSIYGTVHLHGLFMYDDHQSSLTTDVGVITSIVFERQGSVSFDFSEGSYYTSGSDGYWTGNATSVTFVPSASVEVHRIIVTIDDSDAISDLSLCDMQSLLDGKSYLSSHELVVLRQARYYLFVKDRLAECYGLVHGDVGQTYAQGDVIPGGWGGRMTTYYGEPQLMSAIGFKPAVDNIEVLPEEITPGDVGHDYWAHYVVLRNVMISDDGRKVTDEDGNEAPIYKWTYGVDPPELPDDLSVPYDVYGIVESFSTGYGSSSEYIYEILPIRYGRANLAGTVCCLEDLLELYPQNRPVEFSCPLIVINQYRNYLYFKDTCGQFGMMYGNMVGGPFENGDSIIGRAYWTTDQDVPQLGADDEWQLVGHGPAVQPLPAAIEDMTEDYVHSYLCFNDVEIFEEDNQFYIEGLWGDRLPLYNRFQIELPPQNPLDDSGGIYPWGDDEVTIATINTLIDQILSGDYEYVTRWTPPDGYNGFLTYDVTGFLTIYDGTLQLCPNEVDFHGWTKKRVLKWDINMDGEVNLADVNAVFGLILDEQASHVETFTVGGVSFSMVEVEGGTFKSRHSPQVTLSPFAIGQTEVTQALWVAVMGSNPSNFNGDGYPGGPDNPVERVSWDDCQEFIAKLNEMTGRTFRLPSEAEWEFAARGGNYSHGYKFAGSDDKDEVAWHRDNSGHRTHPVAELAPNELGLYDMSGNVEEYCQDGWGNNYFCTNPLTNPIMPTTDGEHVACGGSWNYTGSLVSSGPASAAWPTRGLRLAMGEPAYDTPLSLSKDDVEINDGLCDVVTIAGGSGLYQVSCNNNEALTISHKDTTIRLDAIEVGTATISVSDLTTGEQATVAVTVNPSEFVMEKFTVGDVKFAMIMVDGGTFMMGATPEQEDEANNDERPVHEVTLSSFFIGQTDVTLGLWIAVTGYNPIQHYIPEQMDDPRIPVMLVSWDDCQEFIAKLNEMTGRTFRMPTEAEWEFAARGGNYSHGYKYAGSDNLGDVAWYEENWEESKEHLVRMKVPNELGLYDMSGLMWEWCQDWYGSYGSEPLVNPVGPESGTNRVIRGGSDSSSNYCRVSCRNSNPPDERLGITLRLVMDDYTSAP